MHSCGLYKNQLKPGKIKLGIKIFFLVVYIFIVIPILYFLAGVPKSGRVSFKADFELHTLLHKTTSTSKPAYHSNGCVG